jgi:hypothetical protein
MKVFIICLIVFAYFAIGSIIAGLEIRWGLIDDEDDGGGIIAGLTIPFWPIVIPISIVIWGCIKLTDWVANDNSKE